jgi:microcystin-dependent protein
MGQPYVGEIRLFGGNFAPVGWMFCDGQQLPIAEYETLFQLIGTTYGGDGQSTFALPDLRGRVPLHRSANTPVAEMGGAETVTLTPQTIPAHAHVQIASSAPATQNTPAGNVLAVSATQDIYVPSGPFAALNPTTVQQAGGGQPHDNMQPYGVVTFIISLFGIFPTPN